MTPAWILRPQPQRIPGPAVARTRNGLLARSKRRLGRRTLRAAEQPHSRARASISPSPSSIRLLRLPPAHRPISPSSSAAGSSALRRSRRPSRWNRERRRRRRRHLHRAGGRSGAASYGRRSRRARALRPQYQRRAGRHRAGHWRACGRVGVRRRAPIRRDGAVSCRTRAPTRVDCATSSSPRLAAAACRSVSLRESIPCAGPVSSRVARTNDRSPSARISAAAIKADLSPTLKRKWQRRAAPVRLSCEWGGQFENLARARARLAIILPITVLIVFALLFVAFASVRDAGARAWSTCRSRSPAEFWHLYCAGSTCRVSAAVGFITLFGVAVMGGLLYVAEINRRLGEPGHVTGGGRRVGSEVAGPAHVHADSGRHAAV